MSTTTLHKPWCTAHVDPDPQEGTPGWCANETTTVHGIDVNILSDVACLDGGVGIEVFSPAGGADDFLRPWQVREVAAALVKAAEVVEAETRPWSRRIAAILAAACEAQGVTAEEAATVMGSTWLRVHVEPGQAQAWLSGREAFDVDAAERLCDRLGLDIAEVAARAKA